MSVRLQDGGPAFPRAATLDPMGGVFNNEQNGMSVRAYFAAHAPDVPEDFAWVQGETDQAQRIVRWRWHYASMMLAADAAGGDDA